MEELPFNRLLRLPPGALQDIRKIHDLDRPGRVDEAVDILQNWVRKQEHFVKKDFSREYLEKTLIACKGSVEKSKKLIDRLCTMKTLYSKFFTITNVKVELKKFLEVAYITPLPKITEDFLRVIIIKFNNTPITDDGFISYYRSLIVFSEYIKANDYCNGIIAVYDLRDLNLGEFMTKLNVMDLQQITTILVKGYGGRMKNIYMLTESKLIELLIKTVKQFVSEKIGSRMQAPNLEDLSKYISKEILPVDYGGYEKSFDELSDEWVNEVSSEKHQEYMKMMNKACTDETKRQKENFDEEYLGMPGSFRTLSVD